MLGFGRLEMGYPSMFRVYFNRELRTPPTRENKDGLIGKPVPSKVLALQNTLDRKVRTSFVIFMTVFLQLPK